LGAALIHILAGFDWAIGWSFRSSSYCVLLSQSLTIASNHLGTQMLPIVDIVQSIDSSFLIFHQFADGTWMTGSD
jgi:hypothetical protein